MDCFGRISVRKTCNRLKFSVREMSSQAFVIKSTPDSLKQRFKAFGRKPSLGAACPWYKCY